MSHPIEQLEAIMAQLRDPQERVPLGSEAEL